MPITTSEKKRLAAEANKPKKRTPSEIALQQETFANALFEGATLTNAARAAGLPVTAAGNALRTNEVQLLLAKAREEMTGITTLRRIDVMNMFMEAIDMARTLADPANMINGADKIAKMLGYYAPETKRLEMSVDQSSLKNKLRSLSDEELTELAASRGKIVEGEVVA